jgi:hypothetical protein
MASYRASVVLLALVLTGGHHPFGRAAAGQALLRLSRSFREFIHQYCVGCHNRTADR